jgi:hypothetical protein
VGIGDGFEKELNIFPVSLLLLRDWNREPGLWLLFKTVGGCTGA